MVRPRVTRAGAPRAVFVMVLCLVLVVIAAICSVAFGARIVSLPEVFGGLSGNANEIGELAVQERVPRTVFALVAGAALAVSGLLMQAITRNPIADPGVLGINTGSSLAVVIGIVFFGAAGTGQYIWLSLTGAALTAAFVYFVGSTGAGGTTPVKLALAGVATAAALASLITAIILPRPAAMDIFRYWQIGSLGRSSWDALLVISPFLVAGGVVAILSINALNSLALGDDVATGLGVKVGQTRMLIAASGVLLCASVTAVAGPIAFLGLMVPHAMRMLVGPDMRWLLPLSALSGAALLTITDAVGRVIARPGEISVGILTAIIGAPILIGIARRAKVREL